ncbi:MAG: glycosyl transferase, group 1 [uncultured bacterium]|nr:MAG: glycosyl transferase, group 1 [uncultured bacterium]
MKVDYFVYTGNAYPHKNLKRLVCAMVLLNSKREVVLKISSSRGIFTERLELLIKKNKAEKFIELLGYVPDDKINDLYKNSIAFVFPTLSEGFGLPPKEAIEAGTFAVISDILVLKEIYKDSVLYFDPHNVESIVDAMEKVLKMPENERQKRIKYAQEFLKRYSWQKMAKETLKIYESLK